MKNIAYIYSGEGVSKRSFSQLKETLSSAMPHIEVRAIDANEVRRGHWRNRAVLLALPGGADIPYHKALKGRANGEISRYVHEGGVYLGICAGAYYASAHVEFELGFAHEVTGARELEFFPGRAVGTLFEPGSYCYDSEVAARVASIRIEAKDYPLYYNGGCTFEGADQHAHTTIIGHYTDHPLDLPAIIHCKVGKGCALLSGVHFEFYDDCNLISKRERAALCSALLGSLLPSYQRTCA